MKAITTIGPTWRCKLSVFDYTDSVIEAWRKKPINYCVEVLPMNAPKPVAFSTGTQLYYGPSLSHAVVIVQARTRQTIKLPQTWNKYKALEAFKECMPFEKSVKRQMEAL